MMALDLDGLTYIGRWLLDVTLQGSLVLLVALAAMRGCRQPGARMLIAWGTTLGLAMILVVSLLPFWPRQSFQNVASSINAAHEENLQLSSSSVLSSLDAVLIEARAISEGNDQAIESVASVLQVPAPDAGRAWTRKIAWSQGLTLAWLGFAMGALAWIALGAIRIRIVLREAHDAPDWIWRELKNLVGGKRSPELKCTHRLPVIAVAGAWRPCILLPTASLKSASRASIVPALRHEWAHVRHGDLWLLAGLRVLLPVLGWNPLFWFFRNQIRRDQELLADAAAAAGRPIEYAEALVAWARLAAPARAPFGMAALAMWERQSHLSRRIEMVLHAGQSGGWRASRPARAAIMLALLGGAMAASLFSVRGPALLAQEKPTQQQQKAEQDLAPETTLRLRDAVRSMKADSSQPHIVIENLIAEVAVEKLDAVETTLGDVVEKAIDGKGRVMGQLIVAPAPAQVGEQLIEELQKKQAVQILSAPRMVTISGQPIQLLVGGERAVVRIDETVNGKKENRLETKPYGIQMRLLPRIMKLEANQEAHFAIDLRLESSKFVAGEQTAEDHIPSIESHVLETVAELKTGEVLLLAESSKERAKGADSKPRPLMLALIKPKVIINAQPVADPPQTKEAQTQPLPPRAGDVLASPPTVVESRPGAADNKTAPREQYERSLQELHVLKRHNDDLRSQLEALRSEIVQLSKEKATKTADTTSSDAKQAESKGAQSNFRAPNTDGQPARLSVRSVPADRSTEIRLLELDLQEAQANFRLANSMATQTDMLRKKGVVSEEESQTAKVKAELAAIGVERAQLKLDAAKQVQASPYAVPANRTLPEPKSSDSDLRRH